MKESSEENRKKKKNKFKIRKILKHKLLNKVNYFLSIQETKHPLNKDVFGAAIINPKEHTVIKAAH